MIVAAVAEPRPRFARVKAHPAATDVIQVSADAAFCEEPNR
jgi:hypothetical protein